MPHWDKLRSAIDDRGLTSLISEGGEQAAKNLVSELSEGRTIDNYDPLMSAHNLIWGNASNLIAQVGGNPMAMLDSTQPDHVQCPICYLNWLSAEHDRICKEPDCKKIKGETFDWMIDRASGDALEAWKAMKP